MEDFSTVLLEIQSQNHNVRVGVAIADGDIEAPHFFVAFARGLRSSLHLLFELGKTHLMAWVVENIGVTVRLKETRLIASNTVHV